MVIVKETFHKSYSAHGERGAKNGDPVQYYNDMMSYIFGNTIIDINASENAIKNFRINRSISLLKNVSDGRGYLKTISSLEIISH